ncbi:hypothetical protein K1719_018805 [Acacia pycnantha]|nr:hypothetical protein K1719_018805 [Acacia pycnantha]
MLYVVLQFHYSDMSIWLQNAGILQALCSLAFVLEYWGGNRFPDLFSYITPAHAVSHLKKLVQHDGWQFLVNCEFFLQFGF